MKTIDFETGQRVKVKNTASSREGMHGIVVGVKLKRLATVHGRLQLLETYLVRLDTGTTHNVVPEVLEVAEPVTRGDLDKKVEWLTLPAFVVAAMKGENHGTA